MVTATILPLAATEGAIQQLATTDDAIIIEARLTVASATCPGCGVAATRRQSRYWRIRADLPWQGVPVAVRLQVRRFWCDNPACPRTIFAEQVPALAAPYARKTQRLLTVLTQLGFALGGEGGRRLLAHLGMSASADTLLRLVRRAAVVPAATPTAIGIDDFALRRGQRYGTIISDLATHQPVDILPERSADAVATWLLANPAVTTVARDRSGVDADGIRQGAPTATQVADRWHRLKHVGDRLERVVARHGVALRAASQSPPPEETGPAEPVVPGDDHVLPADQVPPAEPAPPRAPLPSLGEERQQARFAAIQALRQDGHAVSTIARTLGLTRVTARKLPVRGGLPGPRPPQPPARADQPARRLPARALGRRLRQRRPPVAGVARPRLHRLGRRGLPLSGGVADHPTPPGTTTAPDARPPADPTAVPTIPPPSSLVAVAGARRAPGRPAGLSGPPPPGLPDPPTGRRPGPRIRSPAPPARHGGPRCLARAGGGVRHRQVQELRAGAAPKFRRRHRRPARAVQQWPDRGQRDPPEALEAPDVR